MFPLPELTARVAVDALEAGSYEACKAVAPHWKLRYHSSLTVRRSPGGLLRIEPVALELLAETETREAELVRGAALVPPVALERGAQHPALEVLDEHAEVPARQPLRVVGTVRRDPRREVLGPDGHALGERHEAAHLVAQLAHVPRPVVGEEQLERRGLDLRHRARGRRLREEVHHERLDVLA